MVRIGRLSMAMLGLLFAVFFGRWAQQLFTSSELIHFSVNFPGSERAETMSCCDLGGPWARDREDEWNEYAAGGLLPWGEEGAITVDLGKQALPKRLLQPNYISLSSHWIRNVGVQPYNIGLEMDMCGLDLKWETFETAWDPEEQVFTRALEPGETFNMDWFITVPAETRNQSMICDGVLTIQDAETDTPLSEISIKLINSRAES
jgi:hypothetical protein